MPNLGLVLSGGGARGAYQAGVLSAIADICAQSKIKNPFDIYTGISAGAINATMLVGTPLNFCDSTANLVKIWEELSSDQVFISNPLSLSGGGLKWLAELSLGGLKQTPGISLLRTSPLRDLILKSCSFEDIQKRIDNKEVRALAISALDYYTTSTVTFIQGQEDIELWQRVRRRSERAVISAEHMMASAAIPILFPPVKIGSSHYGDGSVRNFSPCSPAIFMGSRKLIAIGVRKRQEVCYSSHSPGLPSSPSLARVINVLLHALMMDGLEIDIERIERINQNLQYVSETERKNLSVGYLDYLWISPSREISAVASKRTGELPTMLRYLLKGLGSLDEASELTSFLLFESQYCKELIELGFEDGMRAKDKIRHFVEH